MDTKSQWEYIKMELIEIRSMVLDLQRGHRNQMVNFNRILNQKPTEEIQIIHEEVRSTRSKSDFYGANQPNWSGSPSSGSESGGFTLNGEKVSDRKISVISHDCLMIETVGNEGVEDKKHEENGDLIDCCEIDSSKRGSGKQSDAIQSVVYQSPLNSPVGFLHPHDSFWTKVVEQGSSLGNRSKREKAQTSFWPISRHLVRPKSNKVSSTWARLMFNLTRTYNFSIDATKFTKYEGMWMGNDHQKPPPPPMPPPSLLPPSSLPNGNHHHYCCRTNSSSQPPTPLAPPTVVVNCRNQLQFDFFPP